MLATKDEIASGVSCSIAFSWVSKNLCLGSTGTWGSPLRDPSPVNLTGMFLRKAAPLYSKRCSFVSSIVKFCIQRLVIMYIMFSYVFFCVEVWAQEHKLPSKQFKW